MEEGGGYEAEAVFRFFPPLAPLSLNWLLLVLRLQPAENGADRSPGASSKKQLKALAAVLSGEDESEQESEAEQVAHGRGASKREVRSTRDVHVRESVPRYLSGLGGRHLRGFIPYATARQRSRTAGAAEQRDFSPGADNRHPPSGSGAWR